MRSTFLLAVIGLFGLMLGGCSGGDSPAKVANKPAGSNGAASGSTASGDATGEPASLGPVAQVASDFLDAIVHGDTQRATKLLTPRAIARFEATDLSFASPELGAPNYKVGEVRRLSETGAAVNCQLSYDEGQDEMVCLLRLVDSGWRVAGIALEIEPGNPISIDFERLGPSSQPQAKEGQFVDQPDAAAPAPRTAAEPATTPPLR